MIAEAYNKDRRLYTEKEMQKFKVMKIEVNVGEFGLMKCHPPTYDYETEMVLKINHKHNNSIYKSEVPIHETPDDDLFPKNRVKNYQILIEGNPEPSQIKLAKTRKSKEASIDLTSPLNLKSVPPASVKSFYSDFYKKGMTNNSKCHQNHLKSKQSLNQTKSELISFIENAKDSFEVINHNRLNFIYKPIELTAEKKTIKDTINKTVLEPSFKDEIKNESCLNFRKSVQFNNPDKAASYRKNCNSTLDFNAKGEGGSIAPINRIPIKNVRSFNFNA